MGDEQRIRLQKILLTLAEDDAEFIRMILEQERGDSYMEGLEDGKERQRYT